MYLSPYVEEPLNSKEIKSFVPELRSRYVFFEFRDSYVRCNIYEHPMYILHIRIMAMVQGDLRLCRYAVGVFDSPGDCSMESLFKNKLLSYFLVEKDSVSQSVNTLWENVFILEM